MSWLERSGRSLPRLRFGPRDLPALLSSPLGRLELKRALLWLAWFPVAPFAALYRRIWLRHHTVVAVTGTFGKTTTTRAIAVTLGTSAPPGNFRTYLALGLLGLRRGGPPAVFEVGVSRPGQMAGYARLLAPRIAVVTAVGSEHLTAFRTLERIQAEKQRLVARLPPDGLAVLNGDDPLVRAMGRASRARQVTFGLGAGNDISAEAIRLDWPAGTRFEVVTPEGRFAASMRLLGRPAVTAALAAVAVARELGQPIATTLERLATVLPAPGRLEPVPLPSGAWLLRDDYKGELETIETALDVLAEIPARRRLVVLGPISEPPHPSRPAYRRIGERLAGIADVVVGCGPYRKPFDALASGARSAGLGRDALVFCGRVAEAAAWLAAALAPGDVVLVKGQGNLRFERIQLTLSGVRVGCELRRCYALGIDCARCPMLRVGWDGRRELT